MDNTNIRVEFRIMGEDYNVEEITDVLKIKPTNSWNKGEIIKNTGKRRTYTLWEYSTETEEVLDVNLHAKKIMEMFSTKIEEIELLKQKYKLDICIEFVIVIENESPPAIYFEPSFIEFAAKIGAQMDIDTYVN